MFLYSFLLALFVTVQSGPEKIRLSDVQVLTLHEGSFTTGRRSSPVPHLTCVSGSACGQIHLKPKTVQCYNQGSDGFDVQWKCTADLDNSVRFGKTDVTCEGYDYPDDPFILRGSCGLEYSLDFVSQTSGHQNSHYSENHKQNQTIPSTLSNFVSMIAIVGLILFLLWLCSPSSSRDDPSGTSSGSGFPGSGGGGSGGGGYGWGSGGPRPPPYDDYSSYDNGASCGSASRGYSGFQQPYNRRGTAAGNRPGFWSGMAAGGLLGYMFGGNRNQGYNRYGSGTGFFNSAPRHSPGTSWGGSAAGPSFSGGSRNATGFGSTRRR